MLMGLHLKFSHYGFNINIYCICFISYKVAVILSSYSLRKRTCDVLNTPLFSINTGCREFSNGTFFNNLM